MSDEIQAEGGYTVVPGQVRALSKDGKAWFTATARNAGAWAKKCRVPQDLAEGKRAVADAKKDTVRDTPRLNRYSAHVAAWLALKAEEEAGDGANAQGVTEWRPRRSFIVERLEHHKRTAKAFGEAQWFAFDDAGKIVLSLSCGRSSALDLALAYNAAGGRLVLLSPEPILDDADVNDCVAIPDQRPPVEPVAVDPLITFAGDDGLLVRTDYGTVAFDRYSDGKAATNRVLVDPARTGTCEVMKLGGNRHDNDPLADNVEDWLRQLAEATPTVLHNGPASKLPRPGVVRFRKTPEAKLLIFTPAGFPPVMVDPAQVREVVVGSKLARVEVVPFGECPVVRVVRADGLIGYLSWFQNVVQYTTNEGRTVVVA